MSDFETVMKHAADIQRENSEEREHLKAELERFNKLYDLQTKALSIAQADLEREREANAKLREALEQISADGCDCLDTYEGGPYLCHGCIAKRAL